MAKTVQKMNQYEILDAIIAESKKGENRFLKIFTDIFGGLVSFDDKAGLYVWDETAAAKSKPKKPREYDVEIEVHGGVADLVKKIPGITLQIRDYDPESEEPCIEANYDDHETIGT